ncbi:hypothetical protein K1719_009359 [Acacia pycnantha]|nr:hypothetical protein K1719_009359 [Acacia pycnantha]
MNHSSDQLLLFFNTLPVLESKLGHFHLLLYALFSHKGKIALVTGDDSGIGRAVCNLINNAARQYEVGSVEEIDEKRLDRVFRTNIFSHGQHMKEGSCIINTTSVTTYKGDAKLLNYTATKGAIVSFTRVLMLELVSRKVRVNGVALGPIWTPLILASFKEVETSQFGEGVPMKRASQPIEVAPSYVFLASNHCSSYITGQVLHPNGILLLPSSKHPHPMIPFLTSLHVYCRWDHCECLKYVWKDPLLMMSNPDLKIKRNQDGIPKEISTPFPPMSLPVAEWDSGEKSGSRQAKGR